MMSPFPSSSAAGRTPQSDSSASALSSSATPSFLLPPHAAAGSAARPPQYAHSSSAPSSSSSSPSSSLLHHESPLPLSSASATSSSSSSAAAAVSSASLSSVYHDKSSSSETVRFLVHRVSCLEAENAELKRSVYSLSLMYNRTMQKIKQDWKQAMTAAAGGDAAAALRLGIDVDSIGVFDLQRSDDSSTDKARHSTARADKRENRKDRGGAGGSRGRAGAAEGGQEERREPQSRPTLAAAGSPWLQDDDASDLRIDRVLSPPSASGSSHSQPHHRSGSSTSTSSSSASSPHLFSKRAELPGHSKAVYALAFSADGRVLASAGMDQTIRLWDINALIASAPVANSSSVSSSPSASSSSSRYQLLSLSPHSLNISSLAFSPSSPSSLISASFDKTVAYHDVTAGRTLLTVDVGSFATSIAASPSSNSASLCWVGTTGRRIALVDARVRSVVSAWENETMVSAVTVSPCTAAGGEEEVMSGDHGGCLKRWSVRMGKCRHVQLNESQRKPISHLHSVNVAQRAAAALDSQAAASSSSTAAAAGGEGGEEEDGDCLTAVNSFDDVVRVYSPPLSLSSAGSGRLGGRRPVLVSGSEEDLRLLHELKGVKNQNWPIKSSFYCGKEYGQREEWKDRHDLLSSSSSSSSRSSSSPPSSPASPVSSSSSSSSDTDETDAPEPEPESSPFAPTISNSASSSSSSSASSAQSAAASHSHRVVDVTSVPAHHSRSRRHAAAAAAAASSSIPQPPPAFSVEHAIMLASGSADGCVYVFDVSAGTGGGRLLHRLEAHKDSRVYTVAFHPTEPLLASAGSDAVLKLWSAKAT